MHVIETERIRQSSRITALAIRDQDLSFENVLFVSQPAAAAIVAQTENGNLTVHNLQGDAAAMVEAVRGDR